MWNANKYRLTFVPSVEKLVVFYYKKTSDKENKCEKDSKRKKRLCFFEIFVIILKRVYSMNYKWMRCPKCGNEHFIKVSKETRIYKFPAYCKRCKKEIVINVEPRAETVNSEMS